MATEAQKRAAMNWRARHDIRRVELLVPGDLLERIDAAADRRELSRARYILGAVEKELDLPLPVDPLDAIHEKLDRLLAAAPVHTPDNVTEDTSEDDLAAVVREYRGKGMPWGSVADVLNKRGLLSPRGKAWGATTLRTYCTRNDIS